MINTDEFGLDQSFQEILYRIDNWINQGSGWIVESIEGFYLNVSSYSSLIGSTYIELPDELKKSTKGLINIQNDDNKCFLWSHIRHLNLIDKNPQGITNKDKESVSKLNYVGINFPASKKDYCKTKVQNKICINVVVFPVYLSDQKFSDSMDLLLISDKFKSHYMYIKDFDRFMFNKIKLRGKKYFCKNCLQCLVINGKQSVKLESGFTSFKNYSKQICVPFKIYADFECILEKVDVDIECSSNGSYTRKYQNHVPCSFAYKVVCVDNKFSKKIVLYRGKHTVRKFIKSILNEYNYCRKVMKKCFCRNLITSAEEEERFAQSNICWICGKLFEISDEKVRDHCCHISGKYRAAAHEIGTYYVFKISLSCFDDKRYVLDDGINTLACFHQDIKNL